VFVAAPVPAVVCVGSVFMPDCPQPMDRANVVANKIANR
jgi:hypothetical protein